MGDSYILNNKYIINDICFKKLVDNASEGDGFLVPLSLVSDLTFNDIDYYFTKLKPIFGFKPEITIVQDGTYYFITGFHILTPVLRKMFAMCVRFLYDIPSNRFKKISRFFLKICEHAGSDDPLMILTIAHNLGMRISDRYQNTNHCFAERCYCRILKIKELHNILQDSDRELLVSEIFSTAEKNYKNIGKFVPEVAKLEDAVSYYIHLRN